MKPVVQSAFTESFYPLLKETFEGPEPTGASAFLNKGTGLFQTLDNISAEVASAQARPEGSTIAAHTEHIRFYVDVHHKLMLGSTEHIDWDHSWRIKTVKGAQWDELRQGLRRAYEAIARELRALDSWGEDEISVALAITSHTAYHLGAIRQLLLAVEPQATN
jgi:hypothetical protein